MTDKRSYSYVNTSKTEFNPSVIEYSAKLGVFIVGTYELVEKDSVLSKLCSEDELKLKNDRVGSLTIVSVDNDRTIGIPHKCEMGGVFDLRLSTCCSTEFSDFEILIVAHANGYFSFYKLSCDGHLSMLNKFKTSSEMLTTVVDLFEFDENRLTVLAAGSTGILSCYRWKLNLDNLLDDVIALPIDKDDTVLEKSLTEFDHPIWYVQAAIQSCTNNFLIYVGSEDSKWRIFLLKSDQYCKIYENCDSTAGVTSFEILPKILNSDSVVKLLVGSYDEYLRLYSIQFQNKTPDINLVTVELVLKIHIEGGGIWRTKTFADQRTVLLSAMYSGANLVRLIDDDGNDNKGDGKLTNQSIVPLQIPNHDSGKLIYGISCTDSWNRILFASFYEKELYLFANCTAS